MINWSEEITIKNYCGYCTKNSITTKCDGSCFSDEKNKVLHAIEMLKQIPEQIEQLKKKEQEFIQFLIDRN